MVARCRPDRTARRHRTRAGASRRNREYPGCANGGQGTRSRRTTRQSGRGDSRIDARASKRRGKRAARTRIAGYAVREVYVEEAIEIARELYCAFVFDDHGPRISLSTQGGIDIEAAAAQSGSALVSLAIDPLTGVSPWRAIALWRQAGIRGPVLRQLGEITARLYDSFVGGDAEIARDQSARHRRAGRARRGRCDGRHRPECHRPPHALEGGRRAGARRGCAQPARDAGRVIDASAAGRSVVTSSSMVTSDCWSAAVAPDSTSMIACSRQADAPRTTASPRRRVRTIGSCGRSSRQSSTIRGFADCWWDSISRKWHAPTFA